MKNLLVGGNGNRLGRVNNALDIGALYLAVFDRHDAMRVHRSNVAACDSYVNGMDLAACHKLRFFDCSLDGIDRRLDIDHDTLL